MNAFILFIAAIISIVTAGEWGHDEHYVDYHGHPKYNFDYSVHDPHTHDQKKQWEHRDGEQVKGSYTVVQPDHKTRTVKYEADKHGFNAEVKYEGHGHDNSYQHGHDYGYQHGNANHEAVIERSDNSGHEEHYVDYHGHPKYHFDYAVHDPHTHDQKSQWETRDGEHVKGSYTLVQPDHKTRTVKYESDKHGFNAEVKYEGQGHYHHQKIGGAYGGF